MLSCSIRFSAPSLWMRGGLESRCVGRVYGADGAVRTIHSNYAAAPRTTTHPQTRCRKPYATDDGRVHPKHVQLRIHQ